MEPKMTMQEERNKQIIREFTKVFKNEHNVDGISHLFDKNFTHHFRMPLPAGLEGFKQIGRMMNGAFPDVAVKEEDLIASGDKVVERSSAVATHKGSLLGEEPTDKHISWTEIHIYQTIATDDIGAFVALAFERGKDFFGLQLEIAGSELTNPQAAQVFSHVLGKPVEFQELPIPEGKEWQQMFRWFNDAGFQGDIGELRKRYP